MKLSLYQEGSTRLHATDPRVKLVVFALWCAALLLFSDPAWLIWPYALLLLLHRLLVRPLRIFLALEGLVLLVGGLSFTFWPLYFWGTGFEGGGALGYGAGMGLRFMAMLQVGLVVMHTTRVEELLAAFTRLRVPYPAVFALGLTFRLIPSLLENAFHVVDAQRLRGLKFSEGHPLRRVARYVPLLIPILAVSLRSSHRMAWALEAKGFGAGGRRVPYQDLRMSGWDWAVLAAGAALTAASVAAWSRGLGV